MEHWAEVASFGLGAAERPLWEEATKCCPQLGPAALKQGWALHHLPKLQPVTAAHDTSAKRCLRNNVCCWGQKEREVLHGGWHCWRHSSRCTVGRRTSGPEGVTSEGLRPTSNSSHGRETPEGFQLWVAYSGAGTALRDCSPGQPMLEQSNMRKKQRADGSNHHALPQDSSAPHHLPKGTETG